MATFGERLKKLRTEKKITQQELATILNINKSSISRYEKDQQIPEIKLLETIADYFDISLDYLLGRSDIMFGERLKELRLKSKLKQSELGEKIGVSASTIGMYEQGRRFADQSTLIKLAEYFNVTTDYLLGHTKTNYSVNANIPGMPSIVCEDNSIYDILDEKKDIKSLEDINKFLENNNYNDEVKEVLKKYMQLDEMDRKAIERMINNAYERLKEDD
ncbi:helix-turn-helix domain-containing protein [Clostridioides difficile]|uniref:helix-turn-helix domain-containing protein n=1 Tax=Clostridioides difficile TaxID=1496 RepID=UPI000BB1EE65|nr:helix-turn-helix domain-containing protein [Clostridioides difficile]HBH0416362.1 helix-turn-helix domain-containing protein [Clostridioides difficile]